MTSSSDMAGVDYIPQFIRENYEFHQYRHSLAILKEDFPNELEDVFAVLSGFTLKKSSIIAKGGRKSPIANELDSAFSERGWVEKGFETSILIDGEEHSSPTHKVDCFKNRIALELEWNNKDPFYDRDLNNFRLLFDLRAISVGVIITRSDELQGLFQELDKGDSYGASTTHMSKLLPRIKGGSGGGCPLLVFGIKRSLYDPNA